MRLLVWADRWLHRVMRGRCWNHQVCLWLSYYQAMKDAERSTDEPVQNAP